MTAPTRTSNKQILDAILDLTVAIKGMAAPAVAPVATPVAIATPIEVAAATAPKAETPVKIEPAVAPVATPVAIATPIEVAAATAPKAETPVKIDAAYLSHVSGGKALAYANKTGEQVVIYARRNGHGETKLAYCAASKWTGLKDKANLGAVATVEPTS